MTAGSVNEGKTRQASDYGYFGCIRRFDRAEDERQHKAMNYGQHQTAGTQNDPICPVAAFRAEVPATALTSRDRTINAESHQSV